jgi:hypothetical protein
MKTFMTCLAASMCVAASLFVAGCSGGSGDGAPGLANVGVADSGSDAQNSTLPAIGEQCSTNVGCQGDGVCLPQQGKSQSSFTCHKPCVDGCAQGEYCAPAESSYPAVCETSAALGEACRAAASVDAPDSCVSGAFCHTPPQSFNPTCAPQNMANGPCDNRGEPYACPDGYVCNSATITDPLTCVPLLATGATCLNDFDCAASDYCKHAGTDAKCTPRVAENGACGDPDSNRPCAKGLTCTYAQKGACTNWLDCQMNQVACCADSNNLGVCTPGPSTMCAPPQGTCQPI